jgi:hypothetical protein
MCHLSTTVPMTTASSPLLFPKIDTDPRLDPRIKKVFAGWPAPVEKPNVSRREELLAQENSPAALAALAHQTAFFDSVDGEEIAQSAGLSVRVETLTSSPDGNTIKIQAETFMLLRMLAFGRALK